jgi:hypothetical protein
MPLKARILIACLSFFLFFFVLNLIRKRRLRIEYSILWLIISSVILVTSIWQSMGDRVARFIGIDYPPALFFLIAIIILILILLHFSTELTKLKDQNKTLAQELSLLKKTNPKR